MDALKKPATGALVVFFVALSSCLLFSFLHPVLPVQTDEFSYLLGADTFLRARLANPPHALPEFFESFHINSVPFYASKYPPAQAVVLAMGKLLLGALQAGVWLSFAVACVFVLWMLRAFFPPAISLAGACVLAANGLFAACWGATFWGGAVAMGAGALCFGSVVRIVRTCRVRYALGLGTGLLVLAQSRPFEGAAAMLPCVVFLGWWLFAGKTFGFRHKLLRCVLPLCVLLAVNVVFTGYYNFKTTGSVRQMPYSLNSKTYLFAPVFLTQKAGPVPTYSHPRIREYYRWFSGVFHPQRKTVGGFVKGALHKVRIYENFYFGNFLLLLLLGLFLGKERIYRKKWFWFFVGSVFSIFTLSLLVVFEQPHYFAPVAPAFVFLWTGGIKGFWEFEWRVKPWGKAICVFIVGFALIENALEGNHYLSCRQRFSVLLKPQVAEKITASAPGRRHLVFVRYSPEQSLDDEWVYNGADIDSQQVVWARDRGFDNQRLIDYYGPDRIVWEVVPGNIRSTVKQLSRTTRTEIEKT